MTTFKKIFLKLSKAGSQIFVCKPLLTMTFQKLSPILFTNNSITLIFLTFHIPRFSILFCLDSVDEIFSKHLIISKKVTDALASLKRMNMNHRSD